MKKVLVTGSTGLLGSTIIRDAPDGVEVIGTYNVNRLIPLSRTRRALYHLDITDREQTRALLDQISPDVVIHTAAKATPDYCAKNPEISRRVNVDGSINIIDWCKDHNASILFFSSNAVFDGTKAPYSEISELAPKDEYGKHKAEIENYLLASGVKYSIIRSMCLYGWNNPYERRNFTSLLIEKNMKGEPMNITNDLFVNFIHVDDVATISWKLALEDMDNETYHIAGSETMTHWLLAQEVAKVFPLDMKLLTPVTQDKLEGFIKRPVDTRFDCSKAEVLLEFKPMSVEEGLKLMRSKVPAWRFV